MDPHTSKELAVFRKFAALCPLGIDLESIRKLDPPRPDVLCGTETGERLEFELVQVVDRGLAKSSSDTAGLQRRLEALASKDENLHGRYRDCLIALDLARQSSNRQRIEAVSSVLRQLSQCKLRAGSRLDVIPEEHRSIVRRVAVEEGLDGGPYFQVTIVGSFGDPTLEAIKKKFSKAYEVTAACALLAYYEQQPMEIGGSWWPDYKHQIAPLFRGSVFSKVWLFDTHSKEILEVDSGHTLPSD